jgi:hypothetical protein
MGRKFPEGTCDSLAYNLLGSVWAGLGHGDIPEAAFLGSVTKIEQLSDERLEVVIDRAVDEQKTTRVLLSVSNGDFSCGPGGLALRLQKGVSSIESVGTELRTFKTAADGSLVMKVQAAERGLVYVVPFAWEDEAWVKWQRIPEEPALPATVTP